MKRNISILIITLIIASCESNNIEGIWISDKSPYDGFVLAYFSKDTATFKYLSSMNYYLDNEPMAFVRNGKKSYLNDSYEIQYKIKDSLELITFERDTMLEIEKFTKLKSYNPNIDLDSFKQSLYGYSLNYNIEGYESQVDFIDSVNTLNHNSVRYPIGLDSYDIFYFGTEIFLISDTGFPNPIQIVSIEDSEIENSIVAKIKGEMIKIHKSKLLNSNDDLIDDWILEGKDLNVFSYNTSVQISKDSFFMNDIAKDKLAFGIVKLSKSEKYVLTSTRAKPFLIEIIKLNENEIELTNFRRRKKSKMYLTRN